MRSCVWLFILLFSPWSIRASVLPDECTAALKTLFKNEINSQEAAEFLHLQGEITLHRLAWAYLKAQKGDADDKVQSFERTILELLNEKYTRQDQAFVKARAAFEEQPLARSTLSDIGPYLKDLLHHEFNSTDRAFLLNESDLKLLAILSQKERSSAVQGQFDHRMLAHKSPQAFLNFTKLVNSAYKTKITEEEDDLKAEARLQGLEKTLHQLQQKLTTFLNSLALPQTCKEVLCESDSLTLQKIFDQNEDVQRILWESIRAKLGSDDQLLDELSYRDIWLKTSVAVNASPQQDPKQSIQRKKTKHTNTSVLANRTGLIIEDPLAIILNDKQGRSRKNWENFDKSFQKAMANAIIKGDKVFEINGSLYDRATGKALKFDAALNSLPPVKAKLFRSYLKPSKAQFTARQVAAMVNGENSFILDEEIYDVSGKRLSTEKVIAKSMSQKLGLTIHPQKYQGMKKDYLAARALALRNNHPNFEVGSLTYDSYTGRNISSPFRKLASQEDIKMIKERRKNYEKLSDKEVVLNYHRDYPQSASCGYYAVIDKKEAQLSIYSHRGNKIYETEVLVGAKSSDQRTIFTKYGDFSKETNQSTGAGVYTIGALKVGKNYYQENYSNNLFSLNDFKNKEGVIAIHQVPNNMSHRYARFGTGEPEDRRVSGGCINLKKNDFLAIKKWLGKDCKVYVLPEERGNHFVLKNDQINFVSDHPIPSKDIGLYNFNPSKKYLPINIKITNEAGNTKDAQAFVKALASEKESLMKLLNVDNDDYNDLASLAYAIMGNESEFGDNWKYSLKEATPGLVSFAKGIKELSISPSSSSRGFTQIKIIPEGEWRKVYPNVTPDKLKDPKNSAIATMAYLADAVNSLKKIAADNKKDPRKVKITRENMVEFLAYLYIGRKRDLTSATSPATPDKNKYIQKLKMHMSYIEILQKIE